MSKRFRKRKSIANYYRYPCSVHHFGSSPHWIGSRQREAATMKQIISEIRLALEDGNMDRLKEALAKDLDSEIKSYKAILGKRHRRRISQPGKRLLLITAIEEQNLEKVKNLLSNGINCNEVQEKLCFVMPSERLYAIHKATTLGLIDFMEVLLNAGANPNVTDQNSNTPLHIAVSQGSNLMARLLLSCGADPKLTDRQGNAAIHIATSQGHLNLVRTLIEFRADIHQMNSVGNQPVHIAAAAGHFHIIHLLCSADPRNVTVRNSAGQGPLHLAAENGHVETVTALLDLFSADPNERNSEGEVPLLRLLLKPYRKNIMRDMIYYYATFMALVQYGASLHVENYTGLTLLEIAEANQYTKIAEFLKTVQDAARSGETKEPKGDENSDAAVISRMQTTAVKASEESRRSSSIEEDAEISAEVLDNLKETERRSSARDISFGTAISSEIIRTDLCEGETASMKQLKPSLKHVAFTLPGDELSDIKSEDFSNSSHMLSAPKTTNTAGETCDHNSITESMQDNKHIPGQVTVLQPLNRNKLPQPVHPLSQVSIINQCGGVMNLNKKKQVCLVGDEKTRALIPHVKDDEKVCETKTGTVCRVKLEQARPSHYVIETVSPPVSHLKVSHSRLPGKTEVDGDLKLNAELNAFNKDIVLSDEDFLEDFVSDSDSSNDSEYDFNNQTNLVEKQNVTMGEQLKSKGTCHLRQGLSVDELVAYFENDMKHRLLNYEKSYGMISYANESKNETMPETQKTLPDVLLCSDNAYRPSQDEDREIFKGDLLTFVNSPQASDQKQILKVTANLERQNDIERSLNKHELQSTTAKCPTDLHFIPSETADLKKSQAIGELKKSARKVTEADDLLIKMQSENNAQVYGGCLTQNNAIIEKDNVIPSGDKKLSIAQSLHWKEDQAEANTRSCADIKNSTWQMQSETCTEFASNDIPCNIDSEDIKQKSKTKKKMKKKFQVNEDLEMTNLMKDSAVISTELSADVRNGEQLHEKVRTSKRNELTATETQALDNCNSPSLNDATASEDHVIGSSSRSNLPTSDLSMETTKSKKKRKKAKEGESVQSKFMESTFDADPAFDFVEQSARQTGINTPQTLVAEVDPSSRTTGWSTKDVTKQRKKKNVSIAAANEFSDASVGDRVLSANYDGVVVKGTEGNWRRNLDKAPFVKQLQEGTDQDQVERFPAYSSGNNTAEQLNTQMTQSKVRRIRSEICSAFGISQDTNIDNDLMKGSSVDSTGTRASMEKVSNWTDCSYEGEEDEGQLLWPEQVALNRGKHKALSRISEINFCVNKTALDKRKPRVLSLTGGYDKPTDGKTNSPQFSMISTSSESSSFVSLGREEQFMNSVSSINDSRHSASASNQQKSFLVQVSKETCVDDDVDRSHPLEKIIDIPSMENYCNYKETDVDEIFNSNDHQIRPEEGTDLPATDQIKISYMQAHNIGTTSESRNDVELSLPVVSSVETLPTRVKKLSKKKKSQNQLEAHQSPNLDSMDTPSDLTVDSPLEPRLCNTSECSDKSPDILEIHLNGSLDDREIIDIDNNTSTATFDAAVEHHKIEEQEKWEAVVENIAGNDDDQRIPSVHSPLVSENSETESDDESDSSDSSSGEFVFGRSRTLFTIKELNAEVDVEDDQPSEIVLGESTHKDTAPPDNDWDDFDFSELHTRPLEKIKLTTQSLETRRRLYEEAETDEEDQMATNANGECLKELPSIIIRSPPLQPCSASPSTQQFSASPTIRQFSAFPYTQQFSASPPIQSCTASLSKQPFSASQSIEPFAVTTDVVVSGFTEQKDPVHVRDVLLPLHEPFVKDVKVLQSKKKKRSVRSFTETSFDDMEPVSLSVFEVGTSTENRTDIVQDNILDETTFHTSSMDKPATNYELSNKFSDSVEKPCVEQECCLSSTASSQSVELEQEPFKISMHSPKSVEVELFESKPPSQDSLGDKEDIQQAVTSSKIISEEQELKKETEDFEDFEDDDIALSRPCKDRLMENNHISKGREIKPNVPTEILNKSELVNENLQKEHIEKVIGDGVDDEVVVFGGFSRQQTGRVSRGRQRKGTRRPISATSDKRTVLVFESPPADDSISGMVSNEISHDRKNAKYINNKNASKSEPTSLSSSFEKAEISPKESDEKSRQVESESASEVMILKKKGTSGKPPLPRAVDSRVLADGSNQPSSDFQGNTFHAVQATVHRMSNTLSNIRDPKMLSSVPGASTVQPQRMGSKRNFPQNVYRESSSFEENFSHVRRSSRKSADHSAFERPRSTEGVRSDPHLIVHHSVLGHSAQRQFHQQPGSQKVWSSEDVRRRQMKTLNREDRLEPISVKPPQKTLQEAAFEAITANMLSQSKLQPRRTAKPGDDGPVTYVRGIYRPHPVIFRGSLSAGSGFDDSQASTDLGYHPSSGSGNESWNGNE